MNADFFEYILLKLLPKVEYVSSYHSIPYYQSIKQDLIYEMNSNNRISVKFDFFISFRELKASKLIHCWFRVSTKSLMLIKSNRYVVVYPLYPSVFSNGGFDTYMGLKFIWDFLKLFPLNLKLENLI